MGKILKQLAKTILQMKKIDQHVRVLATRRGVWDAKKISRIDKYNTLHLKQIVRKYGWPTVALVGKRASHAAWLLVQHADHDVRFQKRCLTLLKKEYIKNPKNIQKQEIAYLTDRVRVNERKKQIFGTQFYIDAKGLFKPRPIFDKVNLSRRRKEYNLGSFRKYLIAGRKYSHSRIKAVKRSSRSG